jgi:colanic acid/amylovoran biosynthesis glycosyltransferase
MTVAVLVSSLQEGSETFVKQHIELLGPNTRVFHGGLTPFLSKTDEHKIDLSLFEKISFLILNFIGKESNIRTYSLKKLIRKENIHCCYAEFGPVGVGALEACKTTGTKLVVNFHGYDAFRHDILRDYSVKYRELFDYCEYIVGVSQSMLLQLESLGCNNAKLIYLPCYPNSRFAELSYEPPKKQISFVGRFVEKKGPWLTLIAFERVLKRHPDAKLMMAGDGPLLSVCKSLSKALKISNVEFTGSLNHEQVTSLYKQTMIYVQHSIVSASGDREGTPVSVMEAMSAGIPIVCTRHQGINDVVEEGVNGLLVDEQDVDSMAQEICALLDSVELRLKLSIAGKKSIESITTTNAASSILHNLTAP